MFKAMEHLVNKCVGEAPTVFERSPAANKCREERAAMFDVLHRLVGLSMREGAARRDKEVREAIANGQPIPS